jgi:2-isopropylmalate synthase
VRRAGGRGVRAAQRARPGAALALEEGATRGEDFELTDYRVRILETGHGTDAIVRVLIDTTDGERTWTTVGVGTNVMEASWEALHDAYLWGLLATPGSAVAPR